MRIAAPTLHGLAGAQPPEGPVRSDLGAAARQFEAIFVRQMLAAARKTDFSGDFLGGQGLATFRQMQDDRFAEMAALQGAFGIARQIEQALQSRLAVPAAASPGREG